MTDMTDKEEHFYGIHTGNQVKRPTRQQAWTSQPQIYHATLATAVSRLVGAECRKKPGHNAWLLIRQTVSEEQFL